MLYLHSSSIGSHGNLKSSNCLVDSRFICKITDFGLLTLRSSIKDSIDYSSLLWTSPELLRNSCRSLKGTIEGDSFSFGIILHEILLRKGTFYLSNSSLTSQMIVENVRNRNDFRPTIDSNELNVEIKQLMKQCWNEDPNQRPDFNQIRQSMKRINKFERFSLYFHHSSTDEFIFLFRICRDGADGGNILDNLLKRMEQYANNLEVNFIFKISLDRYFLSCN